MQFEYFNVKLRQNTALKIKQTVGAVTPPDGYAFGVLSALTNLETVSSDVIQDENSVYVWTLDVKIPTESAMVAYVDYVFEQQSVGRKNVIVKSQTMPTPNAELLGYEYQYMGETNSTYTHGYIYECVTGEPSYESIIGFEPTKIAFDYTRGDLAAFFGEITPNFPQITHGTFTYDIAGNIWTIVGKDANENVIFDNYRLYTEDLEDAGFVFINPPEDYHDGDVFDYSVNFTEIATYNWERIDVQPNHNADIAELQADVAEIQSVIPTQASASNQLADKAYVQTGLDGKQDNLTATNGLTLVNNVISGKSLQDGIADINALIPNQATAQNQLADKAFVNSSIATNTANFIGTFNSVAELEAYSGTKTNNDYAFVIGTDSAGNTTYNRYKYTTATTPASWVYEYTLNNSSFTAAQWAAIQSGITATKVAKYDGYEADIADKQDEITDLATIRAGAAAGATAVQPSDLGNGTITFRQGGTVKGTITTNQSTDSVIDLDAGGGGSSVGRNVGDIFKTNRTDSLAGAVECNGATYNTTDFTGTGSVGELLEAGKLDYVSLPVYVQTLTTLGYCDKIGWGGTGNTTFRVPTLVPKRYVVKVQDPTSENNYTWYRIYNDGWVEQGGQINDTTDGSVSVSLPVRVADANYTPQITGEYISNTGTATNNGASKAAGAFSARGQASFTLWKQGATPYGWQVDAYAQGHTAPTERYMIQLASGATDTALETCTEVLSDVAELKGYDYVVDFQAPTSANNYTWYRKYKSGWVEQGGHTTQGTNPRVVNLPVTMADTHYTITYGGDNSAMPTPLVYSRVTQTYSRATTYFEATGVINNTDGTDYEFDWIVSGMSAS